MGYMLSTALHNFSVSSVFQFDTKTDLRVWFNDFNSAFGHIYHPEPLRLLYDSLELVPEDKVALRFAVYAVLDQLSRRSHRNHCIVSSLGITRSLFESYYSAKNDSTLSKEQQQIIQKLFKRVVDVGLTTDDARILFHKAVQSDESLDMNVLEVLRSGMKVNWPDHFSLRSPASFEVLCDSIRNLPASGLTFIVCLLSSIDTALTSDYGTLDVDMD